MPYPSERAKVLIAGVCGLTLMLGVARFAYTPMLPLMLAQTGLNEAQGAWLASFNYLGYLSGVVIAAFISDMTLKDRLYRIGILLAIATTLGMALTTDWRLWSVLRFFAGLSSAAGLMMGSGLVLNWLLRHHFRSELGIHFGGIGLGIFTSSALLQLLSPEFDWRAQWLWLTGYGLILAVPAWGWLPRPRNSGFTVSGKALKDNPPSRLFLQVFMAAYFCAGVGYVVSATFISAIIEKRSGLSGEGALVFMLLGLAAIPACILWDRVARRSGDLNALVIAFVLHVFGIALPALNESLTVAIIGALLFGATFVGIVSLVLTMAGHYYPSRPAKMMGRMTISYSVAQMLAPALIAVLSIKQDGYLFGLYLATAATLVGILLMLVLKFLEPAHGPAKAVHQGE
jgi:predicted MFS family arabinose efflux permease